MSRHIKSINSTASLTGYKGQLIIAKDNLGRTRANSSQCCKASFKKINYCHPAVFQISWHISNNIPPTSVRADSDILWINSQFHDSNKLLRRDINKRHCSISPVNHQGSLPSIGPEADSNPYRLRPHIDGSSGTLLFYRENGDRTYCTTTGWTVDYPDLIVLFIKGQVNRIVAGTHGQSTRDKKRIRTFGHTFPCFHGNRAGLCPTGHSNGQGSCRAFYNSGGNISKGDLIFLGISRKISSVDNHPIAWMSMCGNNSGNGGPGGVYGHRVDIWLAAIAALIFRYQLKTMNPGG